MYHRFVAIPFPAALAPMDPFLFSPPMDPFFSSRHRDGDVQLQLLELQRQDHQVGPEPQLDEMSTVEGGKAIA